MKHEWTIRLADGSEIEVHEGSARVHVGDSGVTVRYIDPELEIATEQVFYPHHAVRSVTTRRVATA